MKAFNILKEISELDNKEFKLFLLGWSKGFGNEFDCDLLYGLKNFGSTECVISAKSGYMMMISDGIYEQ